MCSVLQVSCKQLFLPAGNDGPEVKEGGIADEILKENLEVRTKAKLLLHGSFRLLSFLI